MKLSDILVEAKQVKTKQVKASSKKPKIVKPNTGGSSKHPYQGKLVGEAEKLPSPKQQNPVAKHSRNKSGAGAHKSPKDYDRKKSKQELKKTLDEAPLVMHYASAYNIALDKTKDWIYSHHSDDKDETIKALSQLGDLVGYTIEKRGKNNVVFNKFFTQTDEE